MRERRRDDGQRLDGVADIGAGEAIVAPAPLLLDAQDPARDELGEMVAGRLSGDPGPGGQLARRPGLAARQGEAHGGSRWIGQKIRHERDVGLRHRAQA